MMESYLPKLKCGGTAYPGRTVAKEYLGETWVAEIVSVAETWIDIKYVGSGSHKSKSCVKRMVDPAEWRAI